VNCPACKSPNEPGAEFCRACATPLKAQPATPLKAQPNTPAATSAPPAASVPASAPTVAATPPAPAAPASQQTSVDAASSPSQASAEPAPGATSAPTKSTRSSRQSQLVAAIVAAVLVIGVVGAVVHGSQAKSASSGTVAADSTSLADSTNTTSDATADTSGHDSTDTTSNESTDTTSSDGTDPTDGGADTTTDASPSSSDSGTKSASSSRAEDGVPEGGTPERVMYDHWTDIGSGDYTAAFDLFASTYSANRERWIADHEQISPRIAGLRIEHIATGPRLARVRVTVTTRDSGSRRCSRFSGEVLVVRQDGEWKYRPRLPDDGPQVFRLVTDRLTRANPSCASTF
jgi:hypothetical protein